RRRSRRRCTSTRPRRSTPERRPSGAFAEACPLASARGSIAVPESSLFEKTPSTGGCPHCIGGLSGGQESWVGQILGRGAAVREGMFRQQGLYAAYALARPRAQGMPMANTRASVHSVWRTAVSSRATLIRWVASALVRIRYGRVLCGGQLAVR